MWDLQAGEPRRPALQFSVSLEMDDVNPTMTLNVSDLRAPRSQRQKDIYAKLGSSSELFPPFSFVLGPLRSW